MAQDPDIFNVNMALNPDSNFIVGLNHAPVTRGEVNTAALMLVKGLLYRNITKGSYIMITMDAGINCILAEVACTLGGYPYIKHRPYSTNMPFHSQLSLNNYASDSLTNTIRKFDVKFVFDNLTFSEVLTGGKVSDIIDYPTLTEMMLINRTSGTTTGISKFIGLTRKNTKDSADVYATIGPESIKQDTEINLLFGNPFTTYLARTLQVMMLNGGCVVNHEPTDVTTETLIRLCETFNPTRISYMRSLGDNHPGRDRILARNPLVAISNDARPSLDVIDAFCKMQLSNTQKTLNILGPNNVKNMLVHMKRLEDAQSSIKVINAFGSSEYTVKFQSEYDDTLENRILKHGKLVSVVEYARLTQDGELEVHPDYSFKYIDNHDNYTTNDNWFKTGNIFSIDSDGYLEYVERKVTI